MAALAALLAVALVASVVLAVRLRARAAECREREAEAHAGARETALVAAVARRLLRAGAVEPQLGWISAQVAEALGAASARIEFGSAPSPRGGERAARLPLEGRAAWLYADGGDDPGRVAEPLAGIMDVAFERGRVAAGEAAAEAARRGDLAKPAVLPLVSQDLRPVGHAMGEAVEAMPPGARTPRLHDAVERATRLVDDLVSLSRLESGTHRTAPEPVDLREVVAAAVDGRPEVEIALPAELPAVSADRDQLQRVFANLLDNAIRFSPAGTPVRVTGGVGGGRATVRVIDRGPGIPANLRARVFEPFFQGRPSDEGAGLGLAVSRGFVEANGGGILVQGGAHGAAAGALTPPPALGPAPRRPSALP